jgi:hypothetical protein
MRHKVVQPQVKGFDAYPVKLGDLMRGERATLGKSLLDVQRDLRIKAVYISAIENCDPTAFHSPGFVGGYVRSYARYLGLDPEVTYEQFCSESEFAGVHAGARSRIKIPGVAPIRTALSSKATGDALSNPRAPFSPAGVGFFDVVSPSGLGSALVLLVLIFGLGYGAWAVLQDIQRVEFDPGNTSDPSVSVAIVASETPAAGVKREAKLDPDSLDRLYRPQELDVPIMVPRDGPIVGLNPATIGALVQGGGNIVVANESNPEIAETPRATAPEAPRVAIVASRPAWISVSQADGAILFERILDGGESFLLPLSQNSAMLRAGNASSVYLSIDGKAYGPVGQGTSVVKDVALAATGISKSFAVVKDIAELKVLDAASVITLNDTQ